jgi:hypothetical protein
MSDSPFRALLSTIKNPVKGYSRQGVRLTDYSEVSGYDAEQKIIPGICDKLGTDCDSTSFLIAPDRQ